jgi:small-conductance mechanosensitive channel
LIPTSPLQAPPAPRLLAAATFLGNPVWAWLWDLGVTAALWGTFLVVRWAVIRRGGRRLAEGTASELDNALVLMARRARPTLLFFPAFHLASRGLDLPHKIERGLDVVTALAILLQVGIWGIAGVNFWVAYTRRHQVEGSAASAALVGALGFLGKVILGSVLLLLALSRLGVDVTALVAGLGIGGIAVALALQNVLGDLLAALSIVLDRPFTLGDTIVVDDIQGKVEKIGLKTTRVRSVTGEQVIFSNSDLLKSRVRNFRRMEERRVLLAFGVDGSTPVDALERIPDLVRQAVEAQPESRFERAHFKGFGDSSFDFEATYFVASAEVVVFMDRQQAVNLALLRAFADAGIELALPESKLRIQRPGSRPEARPERRLEARPEAPRPPVP